MLSGSESKSFSFGKRHYEYDWLRIFAVIAIIFYHVGLIFVNTKPLINTDSWILSNFETSNKLQIALIFLKQWSLSLLFLISGMGIKYALLRKSTSEIIKERIKRLLIPLFFGVIFLNPIQDLYNERLYSSDISLSFNNLILLFKEFRLSFHHLWFIAYLFIFSIVCLPFFKRINKKKVPWINMSSFLKKFYGFIFLAVPLVIYELYLDYFVPNTTIHSFNFNRIVYIIIFVYGYLIASIPSMKEIFLSIRYRNLFLGILIIPIYYYFAKFLDSTTSISAFILISFLKYSCCLIWVFVILSFSIKYLSFKNQFLSFFNEAVYPFYILHQVVLLIIGYEVIQFSISYLQKFGIIFIGTLIVCFLLFQVIKKYMFLRIIFGLKTELSSNKNKRKAAVAS